MAYELRLKEIARARGISQSGLAERLGVSKQAVSGWVNGRHGISLEDACRICDVLGCTLDELAGRAAPTLSEDETLLVASFRECDDRGRHVVMMNALTQRGSARVPSESIAQ